MAIMKKTNSVKKSNGVVLVRARYTEIFGAAAGTLLSQIVYWFKPGAFGKSKLTISKNDRLWLAKRRQDWADECGLSPRQYDTAVSRLISEGVVEKRVWRFRGNPTVHLHLNEARLNYLLGDMEITNVSDPIPVPAISYTETTAETTAESEALAAAPQEMESEAKKSKEAVEEAGTGATKSEKAGAEKKFATENSLLAPHKLVAERTAEDWIAEAKEILEVYRSKDVPPKVAKLATHALAMAWKRHIHEVCGGFVKDLTGKDLGQLKQLLQKLGDASPYALQYAIRNWGKVCFEAKSVKGLSAAPEKPHIGFILAHHDVVMNLMNNSVQSIAKKVVPKPKIEISKPKKPIPASVEEVLAMIDGRL